MFCRARLLRAGTVWVFELVEEAHGSGPYPKRRGGQGNPWLYCLGFFDPQGEHGIDQAVRFVFPLDVIEID